MQVMIVRTSLDSTDDEGGEQLLTDIEDLEGVRTCERFEDKASAQRALAAWHPTRLDERD